MQPLSIGSPKRTRAARRGWADLFPYYAGYPEAFARDLLESAGLPASAVVYDPWNGSGSTTSAAASLGFAALGSDLNPVMIIAAKARLLPSSEWSSLRPLSRRIVQHARTLELDSPGEDALTRWFDPATSAHLRGLERSIFAHFIDDRSISVDGLSCIASTFYVSLFSATRKLSKHFQSSNPTWLKEARTASELISVDRRTLEHFFLDAVERARESIRDAAIETDASSRISLKIQDITKVGAAPCSADIILTSPPYCTRLDYTSATRVEIALLSHLVAQTAKDLSSAMLGSVRVPAHYPAPKRAWGPTSVRLLRKIREHPSHASATYYLKSHLDYFDKYNRSLCNATAALKPGARMVLVVQDSYYKGIKNDLQIITTEMCQRLGLVITQREDFPVLRSMRDVNSRSLAYGANYLTESVLVFRRND